MAPNTLRGDGKRCFSWSEESRLCLASMTQDFDFTMAVKIAVFDELFKETLDSCGLKGMSPGALNSQWSENKPERRGYSWFAFLIEPISEDQVGKRRLMKAAIARIKERLLECGSPSTSGTPSQMRQPIPGIEKRKRITSAEPRSPNEESEPDTYGARPKRARKRVVPFEELPRTDRAAASSKTPSRAPPRLATTTEKLLLERRAGPDLPLLPERHKIASDPWEAPSEEAAHPPLSGLLFRFWSSTSQGLNSEQGFVAARYRDSNIWPSQPPRSCQLDEADLVHHINGSRLCHSTTEDPLTVFQDISTPRLSCPLATSFHGV